MMKDIDLDDGNIKTNIPPITVGEILLSIRDFNTIFTGKLNKKPEIFPGLPIKIVVKRLSNKKVVDLIGIRRIEINKEFNIIWFISNVNNSDSIFIHDNSIVKLNLKTKPVREILDAFDYFKKLYVEKNKKSEKLFLELPIKLAIMESEQLKKEKLVDTLDIAALFMDDKGSGIFFHSFIDDIKLIREDPKMEKILDSSQAKYSKLMKKISDNS